METTKLIELMQQQLELTKQQMAQQQQHLEQQRQDTQQQMAQQQQQLEQQRKDTQRQMGELVEAYMTRQERTAVSIPEFSAFDSTQELWQDYWSRYVNFLAVHSIPKEKAAQAFLNSQSRRTYKVLANVASQMKPPRSVHELSLDEIEGFMRVQYDPSKFIVRERYNFWREMKRKPGENIQELANRIRDDAVSCDFPAIKDPLDEALRTRFICSVGNEAVLKACFKCKEEELSFNKAIQIAVEVED